MLLNNGMFFGDQCAGIRGFPIRRRIVASVILVSAASNRALLQDDRQCLVSIERKVQGPFLPGCMTAIRNNAQIVTSGFHEYVGPAEMKLVSMQIASNNQELSFERTPGRNLELRQKLF